MRGKDTCNEECTNNDDDEVKDDVGVFGKVIGCIWYALEGGCIEGRLTLYKVGWYRYRCYYGWLGGWVVVVITLGERVLGGQRDLQATFVWLTAKVKRNQNTIYPKWQFLL